MKKVKPIAGALLFALAFISLSPMIGVHVHSNGAIHSHSHAVNHNHSDRSIPRDEIPWMLLKLALNKSLPLEVAVVLLIGLFLSIASAILGFASSPTVESFSLIDIRDGTAKRSPALRFTQGQRAPPRIPSHA